MHTLIARLHSLALMVSALIIPTALLAQEDAPASGSIDVLPVALVTAATPMLLALVKWAVPRVPKNLIPFLAPFAGALAEMLMHVTTGMNLPPVAIAAAGLAGVGAREALDQLRKRWESVQTAQERKLTGG